ncbi:hypothetical protein PG995_005406 [Apiospora arundinis]
MADTRSRKNLVCVSGRKQPAFGVNDAAQGHVVREDAPDVVGGIEGCMRPPQRLYHLRQAVT